MRSIIFRQRKEKKRNVRNEERNTFVKLSHNNRTKARVVIYVARADILYEKTRTFSSTSSSPPSSFQNVATLREINVSLHLCESYIHRLSFTCTNVNRINSPFCLFSTFTLYNTLFFFLRENEQRNTIRKEYAI